MKAAKVVKKVRSGSLYIDVREYADGRVGFDYLPPGGERIRVRLREKEAAEKRALEMLGTSHAGKIDLLSIKPEEFAEFLAWKAAKRARIDIAPMIKSFLASKTGKGRSEWHLMSLRSTLKGFGERFGERPIDSLTREEVETWIGERDVGPRRWNNIIETIISLYRFARREGFLTAELHPIETIDRKAVKVTVGTYTPEELKRILAAAASTDWLPSIVLGAFAGLRPEEIAPDPRTSKAGLCWENILWEKGKIDVPAEVSKVRRRRFVPLHPAAAAFLAPWRSASGPVVPRKRLTLAMRPIAEASKVKLKSNGLRHSYASYRLAILRNVHELALEMGNSQGIIHTHYLDLKHEDEATEWFAVRPLALHGTRKRKKQPLPLVKGSGE